MCFSPEASFLASFLLTIMGAATLRVASSTLLKWLALVPLFFALQQFSEGIVWLSLQGHAIPPLIARAAEFAFMTFAYLFWPVWMPFALMMSEKNPTRKNIIALSLLLGIAMSSYFIYNTLASSVDEQVQITIVGSSLHFSANNPFWRLAYSIIVLIPCFASSLRWMKLFALLVLASILIAEYFYTSVFVSVWCFFAAILSLSLFGIVRANRI